MKYISIIKNNYPFFVHTYTYHHFLYFHIIIIYTTANQSAVKLKPNKVFVCLIFSATFARSSSDWHTKDVLLTNHQHKKIQRECLMRAFNGINGNMCRQYFSGLFYNAIMIVVMLSELGFVRVAQMNQAEISRMVFIFISQYKSSHIAIDRLDGKRRIKTNSKTPHAHKQQ